MRLVLTGVRTGEETFRKAPLMVFKGYIYSRKGAVAKSYPNEQLKILSEQTL